VVNVLAILRQEGIPGLQLLLKSIFHQDDVISSDSAFKVEVHLVFGNAEQETVVHQVKLHEQVGVLLQRIQNLLSIRVSEVQPKSFSCQQVLVFESLGRFESFLRHLTKSIDQRPFEVKDALNIGGLRFAVAHNDQLYRVLVLHLDSVDTVNPCEET
jgi:hypothetical protein